MSRRLTHTHKVTSRAKKTNYKEVQSWKSSELMLNEKLLICSAWEISMHIHTHIYIHNQISLQILLCVHVTQCLTQSTFSQGGCGGFPYNTNHIPKFVYEIPIGAWFNLCPYFLHPHPLNQTSRHVSTANELEMTPELFQVAWNSPKTRGYCLDGETDFPRPHVQQVLWGV